jgi:hypothetical protein
MCPKWVMYRAETTLIQRDNRTKEFRLEIGSAKEMREDNKSFFRCPRVLTSQLPVTAQSVLRIGYAVH